MRAIQCSAHVTVAFDLGDQVEQVTPDAGGIITKTTPPTAAERDCEALSALARNVAATIPVAPLIMPARQQFLDDAFGSLGEPRGDMLSTEFERPLSLFGPRQMAAAIPTTRSGGFGHFGFAYKRMRRANCMPDPEGRFYCRFAAAQARSGVSARHKFRAESCSTNENLS